MTRLHLQLAAAATTGARLSGWWHGALPVGEQTAVMHVQCRALATLRTKRTGGGMAAILWESAVTLTRRMGRERGARRGGLNDGTVAFWDRRRFHHIYVDHGQRPMIGDLRARGRLTLCTWMLPDLRLGQAVQADLERLLGSTLRMPTVRAEAGRQAADGGRFAP